MPASPTSPTKPKCQDGGARAARARGIDQLWRDYKSSGSAELKAQLTGRLMPTIVATAQRLRRLMGDKPEPSDLVHAGVVGLLEAADRFDPSRGVYFETFCMWRVIGAMHDDQKKFDWATGVVRLKAQRLRRAADELANALGRPPTTHELAEALGVSHAHVADVWRHVEHNAPASIDAWKGEGSLEDTRHDPVRRVLADEARTLLLDALKALPDKQRYVLLLYYFEQLTMAQVGIVLDVTESRVSQLHRQALATLDRRLGKRKHELLDALGG